MKDLTQEQELALFEKFKKMMQEEKKQKKVYHRRPKGTGSIVKLSGNRKKPFAVNVTIGHDDDTGAQIKKCLGTFKTRVEAETALSAYNLHRNGYIDKTDYKELNKAEPSPTFAELWQKVLEEIKDTISINTQKSYKTAFNHLYPLYDYRIDKISLIDIQPIFDREYKNGAGKGKLNTMKIVIRKIYNYAMKYDFCEKDYSAYINIGKQKEARIVRTPYTKEEILSLFDSKEDYDKLTLICIYTGMRPGELIKANLEKINIEQEYMIAGIKTANGINRIIPLHKDIIPLIIDYKNKNLSFKGSSDEAKYHSYVRFFRAKRNSHTPYDTRHTFATMCNEYQLNEYLIKKMMGHSCKDLTKDVYTHATIERLVNEVNKLPGKVSLKNKLYTK